MTSRRLLFAVLVLSHVLAGVSDARAEALPGFMDMVTDASSVFSVPAVPKPGYMVPFVEPTFGTKVQRITGDAGQPIPGVPGGVWGSDARHHYSKDQPWNADNSLMLVQNDGGGGTPSQLLLDGETYEPRYPRCAYTLDDARWHPSLDHAQQLIGVREGPDSLVWFNPVTCTLTRGWKIPIGIDMIGMGEGNPSVSANGRYIALANNNKIVIVDMDPQPPFASYASGNRRIGPVYTIPPCSLSTTLPTACTVGNVSISPRGNYVDVKYKGSTADSTTDDAHRIFEVDLNTLQIKPRVMAAGSLRCGTFQGRPNGWIFPLKHADMAINPYDNNEEVIIGGRACNGSAIGRVVMVRLRDGQVTPLTNPTKEASVRHVSTRNNDRPGWAYVSYYPGIGKKYDDEIVAVRMDGSGTVQRFAHQRSLSSGCYRCEPHAVPSRDGRRVLWASNWAENCTTCGSVSDIKDYIVDARAGATLGNPPVVNAPPIVVVDENAQVVVDVTAVDADGPAITTLTANLSALPGGHNAVFTTNASKTGGTLRWTPTYQDGNVPYPVTFTAFNGGTGTATTLLSVRHVDRLPVLSAPASVNAVGNLPLTVSITVSDPDGDPIGSLTADLSALPLGNDAVFTPGPGNNSATLTWTPAAQDIRETPYAVTFAASNAVTNQATTQIRVTPDLLPVVTAPATLAATENQTLSMSVTAADPDGQPLSSLVADLSALPAGNNAVFTPNLSNAGGTLTWKPTYQDGGAQYPVTFTAANGQSGTASALISVVNVDRLPVVAAPASVAGTEGAMVSISVTAADADSEAITSLTAELGGLPSGHNAVFVADPGNRSGTLTWTPTANDGRSTPYSVTFRAMNGGTGSATTSITIANVDRAPVITAPASVTGNEGATLTVSITAADPDGNSITSLTADLTGLPGASFSASSQKTSGTLTWTPSYTSSRAAPYTVTFTASNALTGTRTTAITVNNVDRAPVLTTPGSPASVNAIENLPLTMSVAASDPDGDPIGSLTADLSALPFGNDAVFTTDPGNNSATLTWTPTTQDIRETPYPVTFTAANAIIVQATTQFQVTPDRPPIVTAPATLATTESQTLSMSVTATDPDGQPLSSLVADLSALPAGNNAVFIPNLSHTGGTLAWTPTYLDGGTQYPVTFTATNGQSGTASALISVANFDHLPVVIAPASVAGTEGAVVSISVTAADADSQAITSLTAELGGLPSGHNAVFIADPGNRSGTLTWTPTGTDGRSLPYSVTFRATNGGTGSATTSITIANVDRAPVITAPASVTGNEGATLTVSITAADPDGDRISSLTADLTGLPGGSFSAGSQKSSGTLTWTPSYTSSRAAPYTVTFTASNALTGTRTTAITVNNVDRAPVLTVPSSVNAVVGTPVQVNVKAADPDGESITTLTADLSLLPAGHNAVFTPDASKTSGTLRWTPKSTETGNFNVTFGAGNALSRTAVTTVKVSRNGAGGAGSELANDENFAIPSVLALSGPNPNPARASATFELALPRAAHVRSTVFDIQGRVMWSDEASHRAGRISWTWNGTSPQGITARAGLYLARFEVGDRVLKRRFVLLR